MVCGRLQHTFEQTSFYFTECFFSKGTVQVIQYITAVLINNMRRKHCSNKRIKEVKKKSTTIDM